MSMTRDHMFLAALAACECLWDRNGAKLTQYFPSAEAAWSANVDELMRAKLSPATANRFIQERARVNPEKIRQQCLATDCAIITTGDTSYPPLLKQIAFPPPALFVRGALNLADRPTLAVVGTRRSSRYGERLIADIIPPLVRAGVVIISGLALGCDALAHHATVTAGGTTVGVLGGGVDDATIYPVANQALARQILQRQGALVSMYPPGIHPRAYTFPQRNRLIAGMAQGTLVIEAPESSGALVTARHALEENREVLAVPGSIYEINAQGTNNLLAAGASLVRSVEDIFNALALAQLPLPALAPPLRQDPLEQAIVLALHKEPLHPDTLINLCDTTPARVLLACTQLELDGMVTRTTDGKFRIKS